ncbi:MAG: galactokinase family protein [Propionicimonas sp.]|nr:galactokinase family protein [Propionicimonas sp.]
MTARWRVPGRIEVLGKHTDYAGGNVLVCAAGRGVTVTGTATGGGRIVARSTSFPEPVILGGGVDAGLPAGHWGRYLQTAIDRLTLNFGPLEGAELRIDSDLPLASGMSSSSALLVAVALVLADLNGLRETPLWAAELGTDRLRLASYLASVENGSSFSGLGGHTGVGTLGGSEDHTAMLCGSPGELGWFGFAPVEQQQSVPWPADQVFVVVTSGVRAEKTGAARELYNRASLATREALAVWNDATGRADRHLATAVRSSDDAVTRLLGLLPAGYLRLRVAQFVRESEVLVPQASAALQTGDLAGFAAATLESQQLAETQLGNQVPQTVALAADAVRLGAVAASAFGAGFGGSVWAVVPSDAAEGFAEEWLAGYARAFPSEAAVATALVTVPSAPAERLD